MPINPRAAKMLKERASEASRRIARPYACPACGADCLRGEDHDKCAVIAVVDPEPVGVTAELLAVMAGRGSYFLCKATAKGGAGAYELHARHPSHNFLAFRKWPIVLEHRCERATNASRT